MVEGQAVTESAATSFNDEVRRIWSALQSLLEPPSSKEKHL
jgi:hypothetical protein